MGDPVITNILKTGAIIYFAPVGETMPDETSVEAGGAWGGNWARVGYTKAPTKAKYEFSIHESKVEEVLGPVKRKKIDEAFAVETVLAEIEADYIALAYGGTVSETGAGAGQKAFEELTVGDEVDLPEYAWGLEGQYEDADGNTQPIRYLIPRATSRINGELEFSKKTDDYPGIPLLIESLANTTNLNELFTWQRVTANAAS
jgi:hypothetical protein